MMQSVIKFSSLICLSLTLGCGSSKKNESKRLIEDSLRTPLETKSDKISSCYRSASSKSKKPVEGTIILQWVINGLGKATNIASKKNTTKNEELAACISKAVKEVSFPKELATRTIQYPFNFKTNK